MKTKTKSKDKGIRLLVILLSAALILTAAFAGAKDSSVDVDKMLQIEDQQEIAAVQRARQLVSAQGSKPRIIATSPATVEIAKRLDLDLVGVCSSTTTPTPKRYKKLPKVGTAMSPDMEKVSSLSPDWILSPISLSSDLKPKYEAINVQYAFLNLNSVQGMYKSIEELGQIFGKEKEAKKLTDSFKKYYEKYSEKHQRKKKPKVMILMGLPGSYIIATPASYVGNLVELAGGENVYRDDSQAFLNVNTEDMKKKDPDIILRTAHALPDQVVDMFNKEFKENDIWKHFDAVKNDRVYDLSYENFGMSANFKYRAALNELEPILYPKSSSDESKAKEKSSNARKKAKNSGAEKKYEKLQKGGSN